MLPVQNFDIQKFPVIKLVQLISFRSIADISRQFDSFPIGAIGCLNVGGGIVSYLAVGDSGGYFTSQLNGLFRGMEISRKARHTCLLLAEALHTRDGSHDG